jgi:transcriptional regulator with XRE-family HTH domain
MAGLTGHQVGSRMGLSQATISRLENNVMVPDPAIVSSYARALGLAAEEERRLVELADRSQNRMTDWRPSQHDIADRQRDVADIEAESHDFRVFQPAVVVGLLQVSEYARAILTRFQSDVLASGSAEPTGLISEAVAARLQRQRVLADPHKKFHFIMSEAVLSNRVCRPADMLAQLDRLREVSLLSNVWLGIIPADTDWGIPPYHGFELLDDEYVMVDLFNTLLTSHGGGDAALYRQIFENMHALSTTEIEPILNKYRGLYLDQLNRLRQRLA